MIWFWDLLWYQCLCLRVWAQWLAISVSLHTPEEGSYSYDSNWIIINTVWFSTWKFLAVLVSMSSRSHCLEVGRPFTSLFQWGKQYIISRLLIWFYPSFNKESNICFMKKPIDIIERFHPYIDLWTFWKLFGLSAWNLLSVALCHQKFRNTVVNINSVLRINYSSNNQV